MSDPTPNAIRPETATSWQCPKCGRWQPPAREPLSPLFNASVLCHCPSAYCDGVRPTPSPPPSAGSAEERLRKLVDLERDLECEIASMIEDVPDDESASLCKAMIALRNAIAALAGK